MSFHENNYLLQDAVAAYLAANLNTYSSGVAAQLPIVKAGDFQDRSRNHIYIMCAELGEGDGVDYGNFTGSVVVGVATLKNTTLSAHRSYTKAVFDLLMDEDFALLVNALETNALRMNQRVPGAKTRIGAISEGLRFCEIEFDVMVYQVS